MNLYRFTLPTALLAMLALGAAPVQAAEHHGEFHGTVGSHSWSGGVHGSAHGTFQRSAHIRSRAVPRAEVRHTFHGNHVNHVFVNGFRFRPRAGVGFGVFLGYPFGYPYYAPWAYWNYPVGPLAYIPGQGYGGVTFAISPGDASVTVDGIYAGVVEQYDNPESPLNLPPGEHRIEIQAPGYRTLDFNVNVERGEVVPYAGDLQHN
jgi:PEGA domain